MAVKLHSNLVKKIIQVSGLTQQYLDPELNSNYVLCTILKCEGQKFPDFLTDPIDLSLSMRIFTLNNNKWF